MKKFIDEFKNFAVKGNMVDLAIGILVGTAFNRVVDSLVGKVLMPPLALLSNGVELANLKYVLRKGSEETEELAIGYGEFINVCIDFLIITLTIFFVIKLMNKLSRRSEDPKDDQVLTPKNIELLSNIENLLRDQNALLKRAKSDEASESSGVG
jgi:large conductance mechanosensitive channel